MPPIRSLKHLDSEHQEGRIQLALNAYNKGEIKSLRAAATAFNVPLTTLFRRHKGTPQHAITYPNSSKLTQLEKDSLTEWILSMDSCAFVSKRHIIKDIANLLLAQRGNTVYQQVGQCWVDRYIICTPTLISYLSRRYNYKRTKCEDSKFI